jgi:hypothetical protein
MKTTILNRRWCAVGSILAVVEAEGAHLNPDDANQVRILYRQTPIFRHLFFRKQCFSLKYVLVAPLKIFGGLSKIGIYVKLKSSVQF